MTTQSQSAFPHPWDLKAEDQVVSFRETVSSIDSCIRSKCSTLDMFGQALDNAALFLSQDNPEEQREQVNMLCASLLRQKEALLSANLKSTSDTLSPIPQKPLTIVYASSHGNSKRFAADLATTLGVDEPLNMKEIHPRQLKGRRVVFIVSTFGVGRPPRDGDNFFYLLRSDAAGDLEGTHVSVLALGSKRFELFAAFGVQLYNELRRCGCSEMTPLECIDSSKGSKKLKAQYGEWKDKFVTVFRALQCR